VLVTRPVRRCRRSELTKAAAITVIPVTAIGTDKLSIWATTWTRAAPTAQTSTAAAAQAINRHTTPDALARKLARPASHAAFAFPLMTMAAMSPSPEPAARPYPEPAARSY
jgi:hypothetical protein